MSNEGPSLSNKLEPGSIIDGRYEVLGIIGRGGFATVYRARQIQLGNEVAIKVLQVSEDFRERFYREAKTAASIIHPDVVSIFDYGVMADDSPYMVMEVLHGHPMDVELRKNGGMEVTRAQRLFTRCLDALQAAHDKNVVHRDLKPANLFLTGSGTRVETIRILDFGIALMLTEDTRLTTTGQLFGTPRYLAPEYIQKNIVTPALDVYQMGLIFVEILTGRNIIEADNNYTFIFAHCNGEISVPKELMDSPLGPVIAQALSTDHTTRFANAGEFRDALEEVDLSGLKGKSYNLPKVREGVEPETMIIMRDYVMPEGATGPKAHMSDDGGTARIKGPAAARAAPAKAAPAKAAATPAEPATVDLTAGTMQLGSDDVEFVPVATPTARAVVEELGSAETAVLDDQEVKAMAVDHDAATRALSSSEVQLHAAASNQVGAAEPEAAPTPSSKLGLIIGIAVVVLIAVGVIGAVVLGGSDDKAPPVAGRPDASAVAAQPDVAEDKPSTPDAAVAVVPDVAVAEPDVPAAVAVEVTVEPAEAAIMLGDQTIGTGGVAQLSFASVGAEPQEVCAQLRGYVRSCRTIVPADAPRLRMTLAREERVNTRRRTTGTDPGKTPPSLELPE